MQILTFSWADLLRSDVRQFARELALCPTPVVPGLRARYFREERRIFRGRYLFDGRTNLATFTRDPSVDPAFARVASYAAKSPAQDAQTGEVALQDIFDRPVFVISAPRAGSTLLYDLLAQSDSFWTIGGESEGPIEGIPSLHLANRCFDSHRLTDVDADPGTVQTLRAAFVAELVDYQGRPYIELVKGERPNQIRLLEKTPENSLRVPFLVAAFPSARFVFLHRDARQNVSSIISAWQHGGFVKIPSLPGWRLGAWNFLLPEGWRQLNGASLLDVAAFQWSSGNQRALDDLDAIPRDRWTSVDYAELVATPEAVARRICEWVGIEVNGRFASILRRPLPISGTTITMPSPIKWRSNPEFHETALRRFTPVIARLRDLDQHAPPPPRRLWSSGPARFSCFLNDVEGGRRQGREEWIINPSFRFQLGSTIPLALVRRTRFRDGFLPDYPLLWIEDPATSVIYPFWVQRNQVYLFSCFIAGGRSPQLDNELAARLSHAGILVTHTSFDDRRGEGDALVDSARTYFAEQRYCELPSLIHSAHVAALSRYYQALISCGEWKLGDSQVHLRHGRHNETVARYFHHQLTALISRIAGEPVKPSYCYVSAYREGAVLRPHVDRKQCEFTVSVSIEHGDLSSREPWPLWFQSHNGKVALTQRPGDAVLFRGCELPHWRERPPAGHVSTMLLFHYVPRDFAEVLD